MKHGLKKSCQKEGYWIKIFDKLRGKIVNWCEQSAPNTGTIEIDGAEKVSFEGYIPAGKYDMAAFFSDEQGRR